MTTESLLRRALEALENSVDLVREDFDNAQELHGRYPSRQARLASYKSDLEKHEAAIEAIRAYLSGGGDGWLPIESAPKSKEVIVWREDVGSFIAKLVTPEEVISDEEMARENFEFPEDFEEWYSDAYGWQEGSEKPTHWMPLPAAPSTKEQK